MQCEYCNGLGTIIDRQGQECSCYFCDGSGEIESEVEDEYEEMEDD